MSNDWEAQEYIWNGRSNAHSASYACAAIHSAFSQNCFSSVTSYLMIRLVLKNIYQSLFGYSAVEPCHFSWVENSEIHNTLGAEMSPHPCPVWLSWFQIP